MKAQQTMHGTIIITPSSMNLVFTSQLFRLILLWTVHTEYRYSSWSITSTSSSPGHSFASLDKCGWNHTQGHGFVLMTTDDLDIILSDPASSRQIGFHLQDRQHLGEALKKYMEDLPVNYDSSKYGAYEYTHTCNDQKYKTDVKINFNGNTIKISDGSSTLTIDLMAEKIVWIWWTVKIVLTVVSAWVFARAFETCDCKVYQWSGMLMGVGSLTNFIVQAWSVGEALFTLNLVLLLINLALTVAWMGTFTIHLNTKGLSLLEVAYYFAMLITHNLALFWVVQYTAVFYTVITPLVLLIEYRKEKEQREAKFNWWMLLSYVCTVCLFALVTSVSVMLIIHRSSSRIGKELVEVGSLWVFLMIVCYFVWEARQARRKKQQGSRLPAEEATSHPDLPLDRQRS